MSEEKKAEADQDDDPKSRREKVEDGFKQGIGLLSAFKDALEETIQEARERGDLSTEKAKEVVKDTLDRAQTAAEDARERLDFANQADLDSLTSVMESVRTRVTALEEAVFGGSKGPASDGSADAPPAQGESEADPDS